MVYYCGYTRIFFVCSKDPHVDTNFHWSQLQSFHISLISQCHDKLSQQNICYCHTLLIINISLSWSSLFFIIFHLISLISLNICWVFSKPYQFCVLLRWNLAISIILTLLLSYMIIFNQQDDLRDVIGTSMEVAWRPISGEAVSTTPYDRIQHPARIRHTRDGQREGFLRV